MINLKLSRRTRPPMLLILALTLSRLSWQCSDTEVDAPDVVTTEDTGVDGAADAEDDSVADVTEDTATGDTGAEDTGAEEPPAPVCGDGDVQGEEACDEGDDNSDTEPDACRTDCTEARCGDGVTDSGEECDDGESGSERCSPTCLDLSAPAPSAAGDVVITEIMRNSADADDLGEWVELYNATDGSLNLAGCVLGDLDVDEHVIGGFRLLVESGGYVVLARSGDAAVNGGFTPDYEYSDFLLGNRADEVLLTCGEVLIDAVVYDDADFWPDETGLSMSLDPGATDEVDNDDPFYWCSGTTAFGDESNFGTPGEANPSCPDRVIDRCRLQAPASQTVSILAEEVAFTGRVYEVGLTDATSGVDLDPLLVAEGGLGPDASDPVDNADWTWAAASATAGWDDAAEADVDEYTATLPSPELGDYDYAFRFSRDGGITWTYCDLDTGTDGEDGSENGYQVDNAGALSVIDPCTPNPCDTPGPPQCEADGVTLDTFSAPGACGIVGISADCTYPFDPFDCSALLGRCDDTGGTAQCVDQAQQPDTAGQVIVTEFMAQSQEGSDPGEWVEVYNATLGTGDERAFNLEGCVLRDDGSDSHTIASVLLIQPGESVVLGRSDHAADNHGAPVDYVYNGFFLANGGDEIALECDSGLIDWVAYTGDLVVEGAAAQLTPDIYAIACDVGTCDGDDPCCHQLNDDALNFCVARDSYGTAGKLGSPGAVNPTCPDVTVDDCILHRPVDAEFLAGTDGTIYGRIFEADVTDATVGTDAAASLVGQVGYGPPGSDPSTDDTDWTWFYAEANGGWNDGGPGAEWEDWDEYVAIIDPVPSQGDYLHAFRFSLDDGRRWAYCDSDGGPYELANAGTLTSLPSPCEPNPCTDPFPPECEADGVTLTTYLAPGNCEVVGVEADCVSYPYEQFDCSTLLGTCDDGDGSGECVGTAIQPDTAGQIIVTEFMARSQSGTDNGEWVEIYNATAGTAGERPFNLEGCVLRDDDFDSHTIGEALFILPGEHLVLAKSEDAVANHGLPYDYVYSGFNLTNSDGGGFIDEIILECGGILIDSVEYTADQVNLGAAAQLSPDFYGICDFGTCDGDDPCCHELNDDLANYCVATEVYGTADKLGTPGTANSACPDTTIDSCILDRPVDTSFRAGLTGTVYGRVYDADVTDQTTGVDTDPNLVGQVGYGPPDSDPSTDDTGWTWFDAVPNGAWNDTEKPGWDEYMATIDPVPPERVDPPYWHAYRFSLDGGTTWTYCDSDGSGIGDAYEPGNAGTFTSVGSPCAPNPCSKAPQCDGNTRVAYVSPGHCCEGIAPEECVEPICTYDEIPYDCSLDGSGECVEGACTTPRPPLEAGELVITEIMYNPDDPLGDPEFGEWFEIYNTTSETLRLSDAVAADPTCIIEDGDGIQTTLEGDLTVAPGEYAVFAHCDDDAVACTDGGNGGLTVFAVFDAWLDNNGESISLTCNGVVIDSVTYDVDGTSFPIANATSLALDPSSYDATANDDGANWCLGFDQYYPAPGGTETPHYGTPGQANPSCVNTVDDCYLDRPLALTGIDARTLQSAFGRVKVNDITDVTSGVDRHPALIASGGYGPDGSDPATSGAWSWLDAEPVDDWDDSVEPDYDEYSVTFLAPPAGSYDYALRFSIDGGRSWTVCELSAGGIAPMTTVAAACNVAEVNMFFSEYVEGSSSNKALEIFNAGTAGQTIPYCDVLLYFNGDTEPASPISVLIPPAPGDVVVLCDPDMEDGDEVFDLAPGTCDQLKGGAWFNGDDAVELRCGCTPTDDGSWTAEDIIGEIGFDPGSQWGTDLQSTADNTLRRNCSVTAGDTDGTNAFVPSAEWSGYAKDTFDDVGTYTCE